MKRREDEEGLRMVSAWERAAPVMEELRRQAIREADTSRFIAETTKLFAALRAGFAPRHTSGLVEQQAWFRKATP